MLYIYYIIIILLIIIFKNQNIILILKINEGFSVIVSKINYVINKYKLDDIICIDNVVTKTKSLL